jgi:hypothetical protein
MLVAAFALAQSATGPNVPSTPSQGKNQGRYLPGGTSDVFTLTIGAWEMQPEISTMATSFTFVDAGGYLRASSTGGTLTSSLHLPAGVLIDHIELDACDEDAVNDIGAVVFSICGDSGGGPSGCSTIDSITPPTGQPGCYFHTGTAGLNYTLQDNTNNDYVFEVGLPNSNTVGFRGLKVYYKLQVSPAPGSPTFGDVPTSDPGFQYIEALVAAGITAGCGGGNYCPDNPLTRRQMAVFISKALGLRWPG